MTPSPTSPCPDGLLPRAPASPLASPLESLMDALQTRIAVLHAQIRSLRARAPGAGPCAAHAAGEVAP